MSIVSSDSINQIRSKIVYRNSIFGNLFYLVAFLMLLLTRDSVLTIAWGRVWMITCGVIWLLRLGLSINQVRRGGDSSYPLRFLLLSVALPVSISAVACFPINSAEQSPAVFLFCFFLMAVGSSVVFHAMAVVVSLINSVVFFTLTGYYLLKLNAYGGADDIHWLTMAFFPCVFFFNVVIARALRESTEKTTAIIGQLEESNSKISAQAEELAALAEEKQIAADRAEAASRSKSAFLANISHEIRTPLNSVIGFSQVLEGDKSVPEHCVENIKRINSSGQHLLLLINDVLDMSKIEANQLELEPEPVNLRNLLETVRDLIRSRAEDQGVTMDLEIDPATPTTIEVDSLKLRQVLLNLLGNAVKFTKEGSVTLVCDYAAEDGCFTLGVRDTGCGIRENEMEKLFRPFEQCTGGQAAGGTGLGLSISRRIVELMGGQLQAESRYGFGSYFYLQVAFPVVEAQPEARPAASRADDVSTSETKAAAASLSDECVLVVDDIQSNRLLLKTVLKSLKVKTVEAADGLQAIEQWREHNPSLILMDKRMPNLDGYGAAREIKSLAEKQEQDSPVILSVSADALADSASMEEASSVIDGFIAKPFDIRDVKKQVEIALCG